MTPITPEQMADFAPARDVQISPDGRYAVCVRLSNAKTDTPQCPGELWCIDLRSSSAEGRRAWRLPPAVGTSQRARWHPNSRELVFLADQGQADGNRLYRIAVEGAPDREPTRVCDLAGELDLPAWSPDGARIAFTYAAPAPATTLASDAQVEDEGARYRRLWLTEADTGRAHPLTEDAYAIHEFVWSPSGDQIAVIAKAGDASFTGWYTAQIYIVDVNDAAGKLHQICTMTKQICGLTWSPDGQSLAFLTSAISDPPLCSGDLCVVAASGGVPRTVTPPDLPFSLTQVIWNEAGGLVYSARQLDGTSFGRLTLTSGQTEVLWSAYAMIGDMSVPRISLAADGDQFAAVLERPDAAPQVWAGRLSQAGDWRQVSDFVYPALSMGRMEALRWRSFDDMEIVGHVVYPLDYEAGRAYPTFVQVHGGPTWGWLPDYPIYWESWSQYLASQGYLVLLPNIRGSTGRGTAYAETNLGDLGGGDWQDVLAGVDHLIALGLADPERLAIGGWSYGGCMAAWAVSQTGRFKAAIMGAGVANWESYYAQNSIREAQRIFFQSTPYENPNLHRQRSALHTITQATTPTLILHGREDQDVGLPQSYEMYIALKTLGVPTRMVTYLREPHTIFERGHQIDLLREISAWLKRFV